MNCKKLLVTLFLLLTSHAIFSQSVVVNKYQNTGTTADIFELLVVQNNLDMRGFIVKTFSSSNANDNGGSITFNNIAFWSSMRAGTLIVVRLTSVAAADITSSCSDFNLDIGGANTTYFTVNSGTFDLAGNDMCMIKTGTTTGGANNIHTLRAGAAAAQWTGMSGGARLGTTATVSGTNFATVDNASAVIGDYNLNTTGVTVGGGYTFGIGNNANNTNFINFLRGPISAVATSITDVSFNANWAAVTGATSYILDVSTVSTFASFVAGFNGLNVGNVITYNVPGLSAGTYYYRVRAVNATPTTSGNSCTQTVNTAKVTQANGDWNVGATWVGGFVPAATDNVFIKHSIYLTGIASTTTRNAGTQTTVDVGATLATANVGVSNNNTYANNGTTTINGTFRIEDLATAVTVSIITGNNFVYGAAGTLQFNNSLPLGRLVNSGDVYWPTTNGPFNVTVSKGGISMQAGAARTVNGALVTPATLALTTTGVKTIASSSDITIAGTATVYATTSFQTASPIYTTNSTLIYSSGGTYTRFLEWNAAGIGTIGVTPGYPYNVKITNNTQLRYSTSTGIQRAMKGDLTIDPGSNFRLDVLATVPDADLTIGGSVTNNGTFVFSKANGGNVVVGGNFISSGTVTMSTTALQGGHLKVGGDFNNTGTFTVIDRSIYFTKTGIQTVSSSSALAFPYVYTTGSGTTVQLSNNLTISAPSASVNSGVAVTFGNVVDVIDLNGKTLTIGTAAVANTITGSGSFKGSTTSNLSLLGTGSIGTLKFAGDLNLATFTIDRTASAVGCVMGSGLTVNTSLVLTNGLIDLVANTMTLTSGCSNTFTASVNSFVVANVTAGGVLSKAITATGTTYNFPIGDNTGTVEYSPAAVNYTSGTVDVTSFLGMAVDDSKQTNFPSTTDFLTRYWSLTNTGTFTTPVYTFDGTYTNSVADITGSVVGAYYKSNQWDGADWTNNGTAIGPPTTGAITKTGCTLATGTNHITAGLRNQEIDIRGGGNIIANGATTTNGLNGTAFGTQTLGSNTSNTFTIFNRGGLNLNLTGAPLVQITGAAASDFVVTAFPTTPVTAESSTTFIITFTPSYAGTRTATVSIANNDSDENPYTFVVDGTGDCPVAAVNTIIPNSGPVGTEVTITATANNLTAATATFNGISATVTQIDATHITAIVPATAVSGTLLTTNNLGCQAANTFTVIDNASTSCEGGLAASDLFFSEITDSNTGGLTYVEIYNGTGVAKNLGTYIIKLAANGSATYSATITLSSVSLPTGSTYIVALGDDDLCGTYGGDGNLAVQISGGLGINFDAYVVGPPSKGNDHYALFNAATQIDSWGTYLNPSWAPASIGTEGATFRRKNTVTAPNTTYSNSDWNIVDFFGKGTTYCVNNDYSNIGVYNYRTGVPPTVTSLSYTPTCKATTLTVTGTEGFVGGLGLVYKWYAVQNGSNTWNLISDGGIYSGATSNSLYISDIATVLNYQFYCQVWENAATCFISSNAIKITSTVSTTWQAGNIWTNGVPTINTGVTIDNDYDTSNILSPSFDACSLTINSGKTVTIRANDYVNIQNDLTVTGTLNVENNGSLVMIDDNGLVTNTGTTNIKRTSTPYERFDYVYWSSPVVTANANIASTFTGWRTDYSFEFNTANFYDVKTINSSGTVTSVTSDSFDDYAPSAWQTYSGNMTRGKGYAIMAPTNVVFSPSAPGATITFSGKVNNGLIPLALVETANIDAGYIGVNNPNDDFNFVGNPYPSALFANKFIVDNGSNTSGTLYFWTHVLNVSISNPGPNVYNFISDDYALYNLTGGTRASLTTPASSVPTGYIGSGQGFFVEAQSTNNLVFNNSMRSKTYANNTFFKTSTIETNENDRLWLNLLNTDGLFSQQLIGYFDETTLGFDWGYDGKVNLSNNYVSFYSLAGDEKYKIQARPTFSTTDIVPLGYFSAVAGEFTISIDKVEGILSAESTSVYLEDKVLNIIHDLKQSPYIFTTVFGRYEDRFVLRYSDIALSNPDFETLNSSITVATNLGELIVNSHIEMIREVTVYDILGRQLFEAKSINNNNFITSNISMSQQALIVKIKLENGIIVTRKIIL